MSTNKEWLSALNLLIFFEKGLWGKWRLDLIFFWKIVKIMGIIPKFHFFQKAYWKFAAVKKNKSYRINFSVIFHFSILLLKESLKRCVIFSNFYSVFEKSAMISPQELSFNHNLKECLISKDLQIIRKNNRLCFDKLLFKLHC